MFFDKKNEKGLPDLPAAGGSFRRSYDEDMGDEDSEEHPLPAFPDSPTHNKFSQEAIKDAVSDSPRDYEDYENTEDHNQKDIKVVEMEEWSPSMNSGDSVSSTSTSLSSSLGEPPSFKNYPREFSKESKSGDVFVKIDKFHSARKALREIAQNLEDIDDFIKKIRETKLREEQELGSWERDVANIKARIKDVTETIFEKVE